MEDRLTISIVKTDVEADADAICVTLFEEEGRLMGWFIGPIERTRSGFAIPYLARSARYGVGAALAAAISKALANRRNICVIDPQNLWATV
jgi:hypothetical protein